MHKLTRAALLAAALGFCGWSLVGTPLSAAKDATLPARFQKWLDEVALLMSPAERKQFLALKEDARRDAFIEAFWKARDPDPAHPDGSFHRTYYERREQARERFKSLNPDAAKIWILNGEPAEIYRMDCGLAFWPLEIWYYRATPRMARAVTLLFYRPAGGPELTLWHAEDGTDMLMAIPSPEKESDLASPLGSQRGMESATGAAAWQRFIKYIDRFCRSDEDADRLLAVVRDVQTFGRGGTTLAEAPVPADPEWLSTFAGGSTDAPSSEARDPLSAAELRWLDDVAVLITPEERRTYLGLPRTYQRAGFVEAFWKARDKTPKTPENEARSIFEAREETARKRWGSLAPDQARVYLVNGEAIGTVDTDCNGNVWPLQLWRYAYSDRSRRPFELLFYQPASVGAYRLWHVEEGYGVLQRRPTIDAMAIANPRPGFGFNGEFGAFYENLKGWCPSEAEPIVAAMRKLEQGDRMLAEVVEEAPPADLEWLATFRTFSTEVTPSDEPLEAELEVDFPGRHQSRTLVRGTLLVPGGGAGAAPARAFSLTGEVLRGDVLHESFRYVFQLTAPADDGSYPLVFERFLRPGDFHFVLKLEDTTSGRAVRIVRDVTVPAPPAEVAAGNGAEAAPPPQPGAEGFRLLAPATDLVSGVVRIDAEVGDPNVREVSFSVDDKPILTKRRPPWSVELRLGELPRSMRVRAVARDAAGEVVAEDEVELNPAPHRFAVRVVEPRENVINRAGVLGRATAAGRRPLRVRAEVQVPPDKTVDRLEIFLDDAKVATLFQEPWEVQLPPLPSPPPTFLRAVAYLADGATAEDVVLLAGGDTQRGRLDVDLVEVYTAALDASGRPVQDLAESDFAVREDGRPQALRRFQRVTDLPLQVGMLVDTSASMTEMLPKVQDAALRFFRESLTPADRAAVVTFSEEPRLAAPFTRDLSRLGAALVGLQAARGTALWDSVVYTLHYFQGTPGRRALLVFSDGADHGSRFTYDQALAYAEHSGVSVYALSFGSAATTVLEGGRRRLANLAEATGGRSFVLGSADELPATYKAIDEDLRSQYLLVYQSDGQGEAFRAVDVQIKRPGVTARTMRGYIP
ncbi:MAG TPA: VWA domain-containing protein [Thermoanaerobaculia bacterium]|nr:VWA domain-containing protein [Thermoanaerobaculia bacterium]